MGAANPSRSWPRRAAAVCLTVGLMVLVSTGACRGGASATDPGPRLPDTPGTISGSVRGPDGSSRIDGRLVEAINVDTGERLRVTTNPAGGFSLTVKPGRYRVQVALRDGESILKQPGEVRINPSDVDPHADFVIGSVRISSPRYPAYQQHQGLGAPVV